VRAGAPDGCAQALQADGGAQHQHQRGGDADCGQPRRALLANALRRYANRCRATGRAAGRCPSSGPSGREPAAVHRHRAHPGMARFSNSFIPTILSSGAARGAAALLKVPTAMPVSEEILLMLIALDIMRTNNRARAFRNRTSRAPRSISNRHPRARWNHRIGGGFIFRADTSSTSPSAEQAVLAQHHIHRQAVQPGAERLSPRKLPSFSQRARRRPGWTARRVRYRRDTDAAQAVNPVHQCVRYSCSTRSASPRPLPHQRQVLGIHYRTSANHARRRGSQAGSRVEHKVAVVICTSDTPVSRKV